MPNPARIVVLLAVASLVACGAARAHPHPGMNDTTFVRSRPDPGAGPLLWSLGGTVIPQAVGFALLSAPGGDRVPAGLALVVVGLSAGPALGYHVGGRGGRAVFGMALRASVLAAALGLASAGGGPGLDDPLRDVPAALAAGYAIAGLSVAFDVVRLRSRLVEPDLPLLDVIPGRLPSTGATTLALRLRF